MHESQHETGNKHTQMRESSEVVAALRWLTRRAQPLVRHLTAGTGAKVESAVLLLAVAVGAIQFVRVYWLRSEWFRTAPEQVKFFVELAADPLPGLQHMGTEFLALASLAAIAGVGTWLLPFSNAKHPAHIRFAFSALLVAAAVTWVVWVRKSLFFDPVVYFAFPNHPGVPMSAKSALPAVLTTLGILAALVFVYLATHAKGNSPSHETRSGG